jgi:MarR family transcriptional regulator, organic hydroperoxide resistance regulator
MMALMNQAWGLLYDLLLAQRARMPAIAAELDLSPMQIQLLRLIEPERPVAMGKAACGLGCDASNITGIVDRLEAAGLAERRPSPEDRRARVIVVTEAGRRVVREGEAIVRRIQEDVLATLRDDEREAFLGALAKLVCQRLVEPAPTAAPVRRRAGK